MLAQNPDLELINVDKMGIGANPANLHDIENDKRYTFIKGDISNPQLMNRLIHQVDAVVNIAAETHVDRSIADPYVFLQNNTIGTFTILEAIRKHNHKARLLIRLPNLLILILLQKPRLTCLFYLTIKPLA
jgi:dTDP-glucose 4,6-dehydratase